MPVNNNSDNNNQVQSQDGANNNTAQNVDNFGGGASINGYTSPYVNPNLVQNDLGQNQSQSQQDTKQNTQQTLQGQEDVGAAQGQSQQAQGQKGNEPAKPTQAPAGGGLEDLLKSDGGSQPSSSASSQLSGQAQSQPEQPKEQKLQEPEKTDEAKEEKKSDTPEASPLGQAQPAPNNTQPQQGHQNSSEKSDQSPLQASPLQAPSANQPQGAPQGGLPNPSSIPGQASPLGQAQPAPNNTQPQPQQNNQSQIPTVNSINNSPQGLPPQNQNPPQQQQLPQGSNGNISLSGLAQNADNGGMPNAKSNTLNPAQDLAVKKQSSDSKPSDDMAVQTKSNTSSSEPDIGTFLDLVIQKKGSDLHFTKNYPACIRVDGDLTYIGEPLGEEIIKKLIFQTLNGNQRELLEVNKEVDLSYAHADKARFRVNAYFERGTLAAAYRLIPSKIKSLDELRLPTILSDFTQMSQGLFLVTGPTGSGKSTTLAAMLNEINMTQPTHILTIEDPIEYVYSKGKALVDQRELGQDTHDWSIALRSALRQDPDVVLIGEMRDYETIQAAITTAETGHLVFGTLHTSSAAQSIDRIIDVFPPHQQEQVRTQLAVTLKGILSQRLIPKIGGGREAAIELMIVTPAISNLIREGKTYQIDNVISTSYDLGMIHIERSLVKLIREGKIDMETAQEYAIRPEELTKMMKSTG